jgi:predicted negative regulator of RcsB-dependent stress response
VTVTTVPAGYNEAVNAVKAGRGDSVIGALEKIVSDYTMLDYDLKAAYWLAEAYIKKGNPAKVVEYCEKVANNNPLALYSGEMALKYWEALLKTDKLPKLESILNEAVAKGNRETAAYAQIMRGDIKMKQGNQKEALVDGYLRVIVMFEDIKEAQPQALAKSIKAFEDIGQVPYAEKMRKRLLSEFADSEEAQKQKTK